MIIWLRRLFWLGLIGGAGYTGWLAWQRRSSDHLPAPEWPPLDPPESSEPSDRPAAPESGSEPASLSPDDGDAPARWVAPVDGACPEGYPIKANDNSGIFHVPGGRFYERTVPERCYADAADAEADGYRRAKA